MNGQVATGQLQSERPVSYRIIDTVARKTGVAFDELPRLYDVVDPEALDALFDPTNEIFEGHVSFEYAGHIVTVDASGEVTVDSS